MSWPPNAGPPMAGSLPWTPQGVGDPYSNYQMPQQQYYAPSTQQGAFTPPCQYPEPTMPFPSPQSYPPTTEFAGLSLVDSSPYEGLFFCNNYLKTYIYQLFITLSWNIGYAEQPPSAYVPQPPRSCYPDPPNFEQTTRGASGSEELYPPYSANAVMPTMQPAQFLPGFRKCQIRRLIFWDIFIINSPAGIFPLQDSRLVTMELEDIRPLLFHLPCIFQVRTMGGRSGTPNLMMIPLQTLLIGKENGVGLDLLGPLEIEEGFRKERLCSLGSVTEIPVDL